MGYQADRDFDEGLAWEEFGVICPIHKTRYRSDLGPCPYCEDGVPATKCSRCRRSRNGLTCLDPEPTCPEFEEDLDPRGFPGDD